MFSGGSTPSRSAQRRKNRHGMSSCPYQPLLPEEGGTRHLEPHDDEIPKSDHAQIRRPIPIPSGSILDGNDVHRMQDTLHRQEAEYEAKEVGELISSSDGNGLSQLVPVSSDSSGNGSGGWGRTCHTKSLKVMMGPAM